MMGISSAEGQKPGENNPGREILNATAILHS
jgi:hypothetical protein